VCILYSSPKMPAAIHSSLLDASSDSCLYTSHGSNWIACHFRSLYSCIIDVMPSGIEISVTIATSGEDVS